MKKVAFFCETPEYMGDCSLIEVYRWVKARISEGLNIELELDDGIEKYMFLCEDEEVKEKVQEYSVLILNSIGDYTEGELKEEFKKLDLELTEYYG